MRLPSLLSRPASRLLACQRAAFAIASACLTTAPCAEAQARCEDAAAQLEAARRHEASLELAEADRAYASVAACTASDPAGALAAARLAHLRERSDAGYTALAALRRMQSSPSVDARRDLETRIESLSAASLVKWEAHELLAGEDDRAGKAEAASQRRRDIVRQREAPAHLRSEAAALAIDHAIALRDVPRAEAILADGSDVASPTSMRRVARARTALHLSRAAGGTMASIAAMAAVASWRRRARGAPLRGQTIAKLALLPCALVAWLAAGSATLAHLYGTPLPLGAYLRLCAALALSGWVVRLASRWAPRRSALQRAVAAIAAALFTAAAAWLAWQSHRDGFDAWVSA